MSTSLSREDRDVVADALREIRETPPPKDFGYLGCPMMILGVLFLVGLSALLSRGLMAPGVLPKVALFVGGGAIVAGGLLAVTAGGFVRGASIAAAEAALRELENWYGGEQGRDPALRAATLLLCHAVAEYGPTASESFKRADAERRLGDSLPLVVAVEEHLLETEGGIYPVFTSPEDDDDDGKAP